MAGAFPDLQLANRGISGDTSRGLLLRLGQDVLTLEPASVVLLIGTNDLEEGAAPEVVGSNMELLLQALVRADPEMPVVLCEVFPSSAKMRRPTEAIQKVNALYRAAASSHANVVVVPTFELFANESGDAKLDEFPDLLHPNDAGYAKWEDALRSTLVELGLVGSAR